MENEAPGESEAGDAPPSEGEAGAAGEGAAPRGEGVLTLNLALSSKRTKIRLTTAATQHGKNLRRCLLMHNTLLTRISGHIAKFIHTSGLHCTIDL